MAPSSLLYAFTIAILLTGCESSNGWDITPNCFINSASDFTETTQVNRYSNGYRLESIAEEGGFTGPRSKRYSYRANNSGGSTRDSEDDGSLGFTTTTANIDEQGRLISGSSFWAYFDTSSTSRYEISYNSSGQILAFDNFDNLSNYYYDNGRLVKIIKSSASNSIENRTVSFSYDDAFHLVAIHNDSPESSSSRMHSYTCDENNQITNVYETINGNKAGRHNISYDQNGNVSVVKQYYSNGNIGLTTRYRYEPTDENTYNHWMLKFAFDPLGVLDQI